MTQVSYEVQQKTQDGFTVKLGTHQSFEGASSALQMLVVNNPAKTYRIIQRVESVMVDTSQVVPKPQQRRKTKV